MDNLPSITSVAIKRKSKPLGVVVAIATITLENCIAIHNIKLLEYTNGKRQLAFPSIKTEKNGVVSFSDIVHPTNNKFRNYVEKLLFDLYDTGKEVNYDKL